MTSPRQTIRNILPPTQKPDQLKVSDLLDYNTGKSILIGNTWYTVRRQDKGKQLFLVSVAEFEPEPGTDPRWVGFQTIVKNVNDGFWGIQLKDERRGRQGWFGIESPRHEGRHDID